MKKLLALPTGDLIDIDEVISVGGIVDENNFSYFDVKLKDQQEVRIFGNKEKVRKAKQMLLLELGINKQEMKEFMKDEIKESWIKRKINNFINYLLYR